MRKIAKIENPKEPTCKGGYGHILSIEGAFMGRTPIGYCIKCKKIGVYKKIKKLNDEVLCKAKKGYPKNQFKKFVVSCYKIM